MDPQIDQFLEKIRQARPLIHHITNQVTMNDCANAAYAVGARPTMAFYAPEAEQASGQADAAVWNLGTFHPEMAEAIRASLPVVSRRPIPVIIDPVAVPAYPGRWKFLLEILAEFEAIQSRNQLKCRIIIRGNAAELACLGKVLRQPLSPETQTPSAGGVDDLSEQEDPEKICRSFLDIFQKRLPVCAVMTGSTDYIGWTDLFCGTSDSALKDRPLLSSHDSCRLLTCMTGAGCISNTLIAAFAGVAGSGEETVWAARSAVNFLVQSGKNAEKTSPGMGTFRIHLMDELSCGAVLKQDGKGI